MELIVNLFDKYHVSYQGDIYNVRSNRIMRTYTNPQGYAIVQLYDGNSDRKRSVRVCDVVADLYLDTPRRIAGRKYRIHHRNFDKMDSRAENLEYRLK